MPISTSSDSHSLRARLALLVAAALFSTGGAAIKGCTLHGWQVAGLRSGVAGLFLFFALPSARRHLATARAWLVGAVYASTMISFVLANKYASAASAIFIQDLSPLYLLLLGPLVLKEPLKRRDVPFLLAMALGLCLLFVGTEPPVATAPDPQKGRLFALVSSVGWAFTVLGLRWLARGRTREDSPSTGALVAGNVLACVFCLPFALPLPAVGGSDVAVLLYLGVLQIGVAYLCLEAGVRHVPAFEASLLLLLEPVLNPIWAWLVQGEQPGTWTLAAGALILVATAWHTVMAARAAARGATAVGTAPAEARDRNGAPS